jgi:hypothetical protein
MRFEKSKFSVLWEKIRHMGTKRVRFGYDFEVFF